MQQTSSEVGNEIRSQIIIIGECKVGKTSILLRLSQGIFTSSPASIGFTLGVYKKTLVHGGMKLNLELWDTAGQEKNRSFTKAYFNDSRAALIVLDMSKPQTIDDLEYWIKLIAERCDESTIKKLLINKCDIQSENTQIQSEIILQAESLGLKPIFISAQTGQGFDDLSKDLYSQLIQVDFALKQQEIVNSLQSHSGEIPQSRNPTIKNDESQDTEVQRSATLNTVNNNYNNNNTQKTDIPLQTSQLQGKKLSSGKEKKQNDDQSISCC